MTPTETSTSRLRQLPLEIARNTYLIRANQAALGGSLSSGMNSLVIRAAEPVVVDTGMVTDRDIWFDDVFSLVDPDDVRWIFLTHDDDDHSGNLVEALDRCPNASVVMSWASRGRTCAAFGIDPARVRALDDGQTLDVGDRTLRAVRPPVYDSAYTRGLFDPATRVYYASDAFCAAMPSDPVDRVDEMPPQMWADGMAFFHHNSLCPWVKIVDRPVYEAQVSRLAGLGAEVIASSHSPIIPASSLDRAFELLAGLPSAVAPPLSAEGAQLIAGHGARSR